MLFRENGTPAPSPESPQAAEPAPTVGPSAEPCPPRQLQPVHNVLAAPRLRAPRSRGLGAAEFGGAAGQVEAPGETFAQRKIHLQIARQRYKDLRHHRQTESCHCRTEEVRVISELFHPVSVDCKLRQKAATRVDTDVGKAQNSDLMLDTSSLVPDCSSVDKSSRTTSETQGPAHLTPRGNEETLEAGCTVNPGAALGSKARAPSSEVNEHLPQSPVSSQAEDISSDIDSLFLTKLQKITIADRSEPSEENTSTENVPGLRSETPKRPHYMEVIEMRAKNPVPPPHKFKTNVLPTQQSDSPSHCQRGESPASSEEQRHRARQHLDDITAARLLPLHHLPAQLLSIEESLALQKKQKQNYEEMQAKLAAQKLAERLNIKMQSYNPEGESSGRYREVRDEDDAQSSDEF